ncbi:unnamed protein product [Vicia faba]|uniref:Uncharacterized protein n=1 Tax=Vicia faba TaxID=3906 RepID=A0AAV0Z275_VICFA|nr:unnamed protein product [Vicia faba]
MKTKRWTRNKVCGCDSCYQIARNVSKKALKQRFKKTIIQSYNHTRKLNGKRVNGLPCDKYATGKKWVYNCSRHPRKTSSCDYCNMSFIVIEILLWTVCPESTFIPVSYALNAVEVGAFIFHTSSQLSCRIYLVVALPLIPVFCNEISACVVSVIGGVAAAC